jgi:hypothetical protein
MTWYPEPDSEAWRGDVHLECGDVHLEEDWPEELAGPEYWMHRRRADEEQ